jgi:hypothetical protein
MPHASSRKLIVGAIAAALLAVPVMFALPVWSQQHAQGMHGVGHDQLHHWYMTLYDKAGKSCCNLTDCRPTESRVRGEEIEMLVDGEWTVIPSDKILWNKQSPDLGSHVCSPPQPSRYPKGHVFCAVIGSGV